MADLIDRQAAVSICDNAIDLWNGQLGVGALVAVRDAIKVLPSAERHGKWLHKNSTFKNHWLCSECGYTWYFDTKEASYCPHCGARMRGE
jgi:hypothetical protein